MFIGRGAGMMPTASVVVSDILRVAGAAASRPLSFTEDVPLLDVMERESRFYLRFGVIDRIGILSQITKIMADHDISVAGAWAKRSDREVIPLVTMTHNAVQGKVYEALREIESTPGLVKGPSFLAPVHDGEI